MATTAPSTNQASVASDPYRGVGAIRSIIAAQAVRFRARGQFSRILFLSARPRGIILYKYWDHIGPGDAKDTNLASVEIEAPLERHTPGSTTRTPKKFCAVKFLGSPLERGKEISRNLIDRLRAGGDNEAADNIEMRGDSSASHPASWTTALTVQQDRPGVGARVRAPDG